MNLHEYQAKELFKEYDPVGDGRTFRIPLLDGDVATTPEQARAVAERLGGDAWVVKAQVHAGGRGKAGGVKVTKDIKEVAQIASSMLGTHLVTKQTDKKGLPVNSVYVEAGAQIIKEVYLSLLVDRANECYTFIGSSEGGMDIEAVAEKNPEKIIKIPYDFNRPARMLLERSALKLCSNLFFHEDLRAAIKNKIPPNEFNQSVVHSEIYHPLLDLCVSLLGFTEDTDASLIEINPLALITKGKSKSFDVFSRDINIIVLDAKVSIDSNALFRQEELLKYRDTSQEEPLEVKASENNLSYVALEGDIACMVNGAGLAMATMDVIKLHGGEPANFLDVGGGATPDRVKSAFDIIMENPNVKGILVNIFGGIVRCDVIAEGIISAIGESDIDIPIVVRLEGTNVDLGKELLSKSGLKVIPADDLTDAALKIVSSVKDS